MASRLDFFEISFSGGGRSLSGLYANGRQQCKVKIEIRKLGDNFQYEPLSEAEIRSLTLRPFSDNPYPPEAPGWACDDQPNDYNQASDGLSAGRLAPSGQERNDAPQVFYRYLRCDTGKAVSLDFMACITLDSGQQVSTNFSNSEMSFKSLVAIKTRPPYRLLPGDLRLEQTTGFRQEFGKNRLITVDQFNWYLPASLQVVSLKLKGFHTILGITPVNYAYVAMHGEAYAGAIIPKDTGKVTLSNLNVSNILSTPDWADGSYSIGLIDAGHVAIRTIRYVCQGGPEQRNASPAGECSLIDSQGCESRFALVEGSRESGYAPVLTAINPSASAS